MTTRLEIANALTAAEVPVGSGFLAATEFRPTTLKAGNAWAQITAWDRAAGMAYGITWAIYVVLPQDERAAAAWLDANIEDLADALRPEVFVQRMEPITLDAGTAGSLWAVLITAESE